MPASLLPANPSVSKPCIRKHPSLEKIFDQQEDQRRCRLADEPSKKAQSRLYSCIFVFFISISVFLYCNHLDPMTGGTEVHTPGQAPRRSRTPVTAAVDGTATHLPRSLPSSAALRGLGTVFRRGTKAMAELVVAHVSEYTLPQDLRTFLRTLHRSGMTAHADVVLLFPWSAVPEAMVGIIHEEEDHFRRLLHASTEAPSEKLANANASFSVHSPGSAHCQNNVSVSFFNFNAFRKADNENGSQPIWGYSTPNSALHANITGSGDVRFTWGSIVGFDVTELNPDDALQGFIDHPPLQLRRWACYEMLLGMVRHRFKHILLIDVQGGLILNDGLASVRRKVGLYLSLEDRNWGTSFGLPESLLGYKSDDGANEVMVAQGRSHRGVKPPSEATRSVNIEQNGGDHFQTDQVEERTMASENIHNILHVHTTGTVANQMHPNTTATGGVRRQLSMQTSARRRSGRRRRPRKPNGGPYERVYGRRMWSSLEDVERKKKLVNSGVIAGGVQQVRGLASTMVTEIVKVALERKNREPFPDNVLLSYLMHKSSGVLGKRVMDHLHLMENSESFVHSLVGSQQQTLFFKGNQQPYSMVRGNSKSKLWAHVMHLVNKDICLSHADSELVYSDCVEFA